MTALALKFGKTPGEIWSERLWALFLTMTIIGGELALFVLGWREGEPSLMAVISPVVAFAAWQLVSKVTTDAYFSPSIDVRAKEVRGLVDVLCTAAWVVNSAIFLSVLMGGWRR